MATIEIIQGVNGPTYKAVVRIAGHPKHSKTFKSKTLAKEWARTEEYKVRNGELSTGRKEVANRTAKDLFEKYRDTVLPIKSLHTQRTEPTFLTWWERRIGDYRLGNVTPEVIADCLRELSLEGDTRYSDPDKRPPGKKAPQTIKHYRNALHRVFKCAVEWKWLASNPVESVRPIGKLNNHRLRFLDKNEFGALLEACKASENAMLYPIAVFALSTGARKGEILNLTLDDINLDRNTATFQHTKNGERRTVPISSHLKGVLENHINSVEGFYEDVEATTHWLFPRADGLAPMDIRKAWEAARKEAGIKDFRFHDLRHTAASYLAMNGATLLEIASVLGHKTLQMVQRYSHISEQHTAKIVEKMNEKLFTAAE